MSNESAPIRDSNDTAAELPPQSVTIPWVSGLAIIACIGIFFGLTAQDDDESLETLAKFGYLSGNSIWEGGYWALFTSTFVHLALWHMAFNVYWLWVLGSRLEKAIGSLSFLAFFVLAAVVSSAYQLAVSDSTGIGASGVVYAIFGFMWPTRHRYPTFKEVLDVRTVQLFLVCLGVCVVATYLKVWDVGNAAHITGLLFGGAVAGAFALHFKPRLVLAALVVLVAFSIVPLYWCPWSVLWLSTKAYEAHTAEQYKVAIERYTQIIHLDPDNSWAYLNRSIVYQSLGLPEMANADLQRAREIDPSIEFTQ